MAHLQLLAVLVLALAGSSRAHTEVHNGFKIKTEDTPLVVTSDKGDCTWKELDHSNVVVEVEGNGRDEMKCSIKINTEFHSAMDLYVEFMHVGEKAKTMIETINEQEIVLTNDDQDPSKPIALPISKAKVVFKSKDVMEIGQGFILRFQKIYRDDCHQMVKLDKHSHPGYFELPMDFDKKETRRCLWCLRGPKDQRIRFVFANYILGHTPEDGYMYVAEDGNDGFDPDSTDVYDYQSHVPTSLISEDHSICLLTFFNNPDSRLTVEFDLIPENRVQYMKRIKKLPGTENLNQALKQVRYKV